MATRACRTSPRWRIAWMEIASFSYMTTFFIGAMGQGFRWNWFLVISTLVGIVLAAELFRTAVKRRVAEAVTARRDHTDGQDGPDKVTFL